MKRFSDGKILVTFLIQNLEIIISLLIFMGIRALEGGLPKIGTKLAKLHSRKRRFYGYNSYTEGIFLAGSAKKSKLFHFLLFFFEGKIC